MGLCRRHFLSRYQLCSEMLNVRSVLVQSRRFASKQKEASHRPLTLETLKAMVPSAAGYGGALAMLGLYFTDWHLCCNSCLSTTKNSKKRNSLIVVAES